MSNIDPYRKIIFLFLLTTKTTQSVTDFLLLLADYLCTENTNQNAIITLYKIVHPLSFMELYLRLIIYVLMLFQV